MAAKIYITFAINITCHQNLKKNKKKYSTVQKKKKVPYS